jgi:hypothetical protein
MFTIILFGCCKESWTLTVHFLETILTDLKP